MLFFEVNVLKLIHCVNLTVANPSARGAIGLQMVKTNARDSC